MTPQDDLDRELDPRRWITLGVLVITVVLVAMDTSVLNVSIPTMLRDLDTTVSGVSAEVSGKNLDQLLAMQARLQAERDGYASITFPPELLNANTPSAKAAMAEEQRLFGLRASARAGQRAQLAERIAQDEQQIAAYRTQISASRQQSTLIAPELAGIRS